MKPKLFISHISEERELAIILKNDIEERFMGAIEVFVSSDGQSIVAGSEWFEVIKQGLNNSDLMLVLCSRESVVRPWVPFELGAAWMRGINPIPICHTNMLAGLLPAPISMLQAINISDESKLKELVDILHKETGLKIPEAVLYNFSNLEASIRQFEMHYGIDTKVSEALKNILNLLPSMKELFRPNNVGKDFNIRLPEYEMKQLRKDFDTLVALDMVRLNPIQNNNIFIGTIEHGTGSEIQVKITLMENLKRLL